LEYNQRSKRKAKILAYDLEVTPILGWVYGTYKTNVLEIEQHSYIMCFSYQWLGQSKVHNVSLIDFPARYKADPTDDYDVVNALYKLLDEADIVIAHNANGFDNKVSTGRFIAHDMTPPSPYKTVDTLSVARQKARFSSNKLDVLGQQLHIGRKANETHGGLWKACLSGDEKAWKKMIAYCNQDVKLLVKLYDRLLPYITNHPNMANYTDQVSVCPKCGSSHMESKGIRRTNTKVYRRYICHSCGGWAAERIAHEEYDNPEFVNYN